MAAPLQLTRTHRVLIGMVVFGAVIIAGIGFAGSYAAVRELALKKGFGNFSYVFPIGIDAGICVLLALDLLLTWIRIPFPLLRQTAWLLTAATIAFNGAAAWPDPLGVGMHGVIPILFVVSVEAARHAIGRIADITADKHMEGVRLTRWMLSPVPTFLLWRRMKLWELRSYEQVIKLEQERLVYQARLRSRFGRSWRRKAPVESLMPLRLARYGVPLAQTAPAGLAAAGIEPALLPPAPRPEEATEGPGAPSSPPSLRKGEPDAERRPELTDGREPEPTWEEPEPEPDQNQWLHARDPQSVEYRGDYDPAYDPDEQYAQWYAEQQQADEYRQQFEEPPPVQELSPEDTGSFPIPVGPHSTRELGEGGGTPQAEPDEDAYSVDIIGARTTATPRRPATQTADCAVPVSAGDAFTPEPEHRKSVSTGSGAHPAKARRSTRVTADLNGRGADKDNNQPEPPAGLSTVDRYYLAWFQYQNEHGAEPKPEQLSAYLSAHGMHGRGGKPVSPANLRRYLLPFRLYSLWAEQRKNESVPSPDIIAQQCATRGITAQHNKPLTPHYIAHHATDFERRWHAINHDYAEPFFTPVERGGTPHQRETGSSADIIWAGV